MKILKKEDKSLKSKKFDCQITHDKSRLWGDDLVFLICGARGSGKTSLLLNMICRDKPFLKKKFNKIYLFSSTAMSDDKIKCKIIDKIEYGSYFDSYDDSVLEEILEEQQKNIINHGKNKADSLLFIFDDMISDSQAFSNKKNAITKLVFNGRHYKSSCFIISQRYLTIPKNIREQYNVIFCRLENKQEVESLIQEVNFIDSKKLKKIYKEATKEPFHFLQINLCIGDPMKRFFSNFEQLHIEDDDSESD